MEPSRGRTGIRLKAARSTRFSIPNQKVASIPWGFGCASCLFSMGRVWKERCPLSPRAGFLLQEQPVRTKLKICTEEDYLQAHVTVIEREFRGRNRTLHNVRQRVTSVLKEWILADNANLTVQSNPPLRLRAISVSRQFWAGSGSAEPMPPSPNAKPKKNQDTVPILPGTISCA
jgi:hypothetical protein